MAGALAKLGLERGLVVHGTDGLDEITTTGPTIAFEISGRDVRRTEIQPSDFGLPLARGADLAGGERHENCGIAMRILEGTRGPQRDIVIANSAAALVVSGIATGYREGAQRAAHSIDSGAAAAKADALRRFTQAAAAGGA
jgi:anthranilate phosphoribosyltransferase